MYGNNPYLSAYNPQVTVDKINAQINELERLKSQIPQNNQPQQVPNVTQNFQLAPQNHDVIKYASSMEEVQRDMVIGDTPYFSKDMSVVWIKNTKGEIKTYELNEIIPKDEKDLQIELLMSQISELKGMIANERANANVITTEVPADTTRDDESVGKPVKESKSTSVSRVSTSKKKQ
jgi:hypothetical protein